MWDRPPGVVLVESGAVGEAVGEVRALAAELADVGSLLRFDPGHIGGTGNLRYLAAVVDARSQLRARVPDALHEAAEVAQSIVPPGLVLARPIEPPALAAGARVGAAPVTLAYLGRPVRLRVRLSSGEWAPARLAHVLLEAEHHEDQHGEHEHLGDQASHVDRRFGRRVPEWAIAQSADGEYRIAVVPEKLLLPRYEGQHQDQQH